MWRAVFCRTLCNTGIQNPVKYLWYKILFTTVCNPSIFITVAYSESNAFFCTAKHLSRNILCKTLCNPDIFRILGIFRTLVYSEIETYLEPCEYIRWSSLLRTRCSYSRFRGPTYSKHPHIQNQCVSASPKCISCFLELLKYYCIHLQKHELLLSCSSFQLRLNELNGSW